VENLPAIILRIIGRRVEGVLRAKSFSVLHIHHFCFMREGAPMISIDENRCTLCGLCVPVCLRGILKEGDKGVVVTDRELCIFCGHCRAVCPTDAPKFSHLDEDEFEVVLNAGKLPDPSEFLRFLRRRRSTRIYKEKPVEMEKLRMILEAGRFAPTAGNRQPCKYIVVRGRALLDQASLLGIQTLQKLGESVKEAFRRHRQLKEPLPEEFVPIQNYPAVWERMAKKREEGMDLLLYHAPGLILIHTKRGATTSADVDVGLAAMHMILMAETMGLGTCLNGFLVTALRRSEELRKVLKVPAGHQVHAAFTIGYPDVEFLRVVARNPAKVEWIGDSA
jgi:nitroreductase/NAD-dependent dihydropyrimidine dehydrogenase PreA subunit